MSVFWNNYIINVEICKPYFIKSLVLFDLDKLSKFLLLKKRIDQKKIYNKLVEISCVTIRKGV